MLTEYDKIRILLWVGFGVIIVARLIDRYGSEVAILAFPVGIIGTVIFVWGCCLLAKGKGYPNYFGMLGLLSLVGLMILWLIPEKGEKVERSNNVQK